MILDRLTLDGFRLHRRTDVVFGAGLTAVVGANGAGKSTLLEAVTFVLYGEQRGSKDGLRGDDGAPFRVRLEFRLGDTAYVVERRPDRAFLAQATEEGEKRIAEGLSDTTRACVRLLGLSYEQFRNSFLAEQKGLAFLKFRTAAARQEEVARMLGLDRLQKAEKLAAEARRTAAAEAKALEGTVGDEAAIRAAHAEAETAVRTAKAETKTAAMAAQKADAAAAQAEPEGRAAEAYLTLVARSAAAEEAARRARIAVEAARTVRETAGREAAEAAELAGPAARHAALVELRPDVVAAARNLAAAETLDPGGTLSVEQARKDKERLEGAWRDERERAIAARAAAAEAVRTAKNDLAEAEQGVEGAPCPVCGRPLGAEAHAWREELSRRIVEAEARLAEAKRLLDAPVPSEVAAAPDRLEAAQLRAEAARLTALYPQGAADLDAEIESLAPAAARARSLTGADRRLADAAARLQSAERDETRSGEEVRVTRESLAATGLSDEAAARDALARAAEARTSATAARAAHRTAETAQANAERALASAEERLREAKARRETLRAAKHAETLHGAVATEMRALRGALNGSLRPDLESRAGDLLDRMTAGRYRRVRLSPDFEPAVVDDETDRAVLSGGEEDVVALALRLALAESVQDRQGQTLTLLMLDEAFGALDAERRQSLLDVLAGLRERYEQVLIVTHIEDVAQIADQVLRVTRDDTGAARVVSV